MKKWNALVEFDDDISDAVEEVKAINPKYVDYLAERFLALNDKLYLPKIIENIHALKLKDEEAAANQNRDRITSIKSSLGKSNLFEVTGGFCIILDDDYRCLHVYDDGRVDCYKNLSEHSDAFPKDKKWKEIRGAEKAAIVARHGDAIAMAAFNNEKGAAK